MPCTWRDHAPQPASGSIAVRGKGGGDFELVDWIIEANASQLISFKRYRASRMRQGVKYLLGLREFLQERKCRQNVGNVQATSRRHPRTLLNQAFSLCRA